MHIFKYLLMSGSHDAARTGIRRGHEFRHRLCDAANCRKEKSRSPTLGICAIENNTSQPREFYLVGQKKRIAARDNPSLLPLSCSVLFKQEEFVTVGFGDDQLVSDFDQVRVDILTVDEL